MRASPKLRPCMLPSEVRRSLYTSRMAFLSHRTISPSWLLQFCVSRCDQKQSGEITELQTKTKGSFVKAP